ncbi:hypothetical protein ATY35_21320 [Vibrio cidicii]|uniref:Uncharacterized protein n=1 Tax=Vibrio cidicii TaxID=1763883 RepID=A0ABR5W3J5_9VIBR|nr:hypothetical protein [Vibrio cidicii]EHA1124337.1 hypothetical protein [Vibrio navarrensis]EHA1127497.1 hypothetical protein [Vibrio navarrensis]KYN87790.1 hypothetical protein ATY35_21320 [Vibrio cidicii]
MNGSPQVIYYDLLPDNTVSVLVKGCDEWDLFKSMNLLECWAASEFQSVELVSITNTTYQERILLGVFDDFCN